jgi:hypothetical protein
VTIFQTSADYYRFFANESLRGGSPLYQRLSLGIAEDGAVQQLARSRKRGQPPANLIFGAVHYLLLSGVEDELAAYYPSVGGFRPVDDEAYPLFARFCRAHQAELVKIVAAQVTNTNEVGRSALLAPALDMVARLAGAPLGLVEIGSSAGLNLNFDRYGYRYLGANGMPRLERWTDAGLVLQCTLRGPAVPELGATPPAVGSRLGLELQPIDITREEGRLWLTALVWPERLDRLARLDGALAIALAHPPRIRGGDAVLHLADALAAVPRDQVPCVTHTVMVYQLSREQQVAIHEALIASSWRRPVFRVSVEGEVEPPNPVATRNPLKLHRYANGQRSTVVLGECDPHGLWLDWQPPRPAVSSAEGRAAQPIARRARPEPLPIAAVRPELAVRQDRGAAND